MQQTRKIGTIQSFDIVIWEPEVVTGDSANRTTNLIECPDPEEIPINLTKDATRSRITRAVEPRALLIAPERCEAETPPAAAVRSVEPGAGAAEEENVLDWDAWTADPPRRRTGTVRAKLRYAGRPRPAPTDDPPVR